MLVMMILDGWFITKITRLINRGQMRSIKVNLLSYGGGAKYGGGAIPFVILISPKSPPISGLTGGNAPDTGGSVTCVTGCVTVVVAAPAGGMTAPPDDAGASPLGPGATVD